MSAGFYQQSLKVSWKYAWYLQLSWCWWWIIIDAQHSSQLNLHYNVNKCYGVKKKRYVKQLIYSCSWQFITFNGTLPYVWLNFMRCSDNIQTLYRLKPLLIMHSCAVMSRLRNRTHVSHKNIHILLTKENLGTYMQTLECTYVPRVYTEVPASIIWHFCMLGPFIYQFIKGSSMHVLCFYWPLYCFCSVKSI